MTLSVPHDARPAGDDDDGGCTWTVGLGAGLKKREEGDGGKVDRADIRVESQIPLFEILVLP